MLAKIISDNQKDWDQHIPKLMIAYKTTIHESTGYTPFHVTFGRLPVLPVDVMVGAPVKQKGATPSIPQFMKDLCSSLRNVYSQVREGTKTSHHHNKSRCDQRTQLTYTSVLVIKYGSMSQLSKLAQLRNCLLYGVVHILLLISLVF